MNLFAFVGTAFRLLLDFALSVIPTGTSGLLRRNLSRQPALGMDRGTVSNVPQQEIHIIEVLP